MYTVIKCSIVNIYFLQNVQDEEFKIFYLKRYSVVGTIYEVHVFGIEGTEVTFPL